VKLRIAKKILLFSMRGFVGMTTGQWNREKRIYWRKDTIGRAFARLRKAGL
jgi:hypothetical protein